RTPRPASSAPPSPPTGTSSSPPPPERPPPTPRPRTRPAASARACPRPLRRPNRTRSHAMDAADLIRSGDTDAALAALQDQVRAAPGDAGLRVFLAHLLAVRGDWHRAVKQIDVAAELDASRVVLAQALRLIA